MGKNTNQIATNSDADDKLGILLNISPNSKAITYNALTGYPLSYYFSGGSATSFKCVKYSNLSISTATKYITFTVRTYSLFNTTYWGSKNINTTYTNYVYIKNYAGTTLATITLSPGSTSKSATVTVPYNANGYKIELKYTVMYKETIYLKTGYTAASISVQPKCSVVIGGPGGETLYAGSVISSAYSQSSISNGATVTLGTWSIAPSNIVKVLPDSGTVYIDVTMSSTVAITGGTAGSGGGSSSATAVSLIGEWD